MLRTFEATLLVSCAIAIAASPAFAGSWVVTHASTNGQSSPTDTPNVAAFGFSAATTSGAAATAAGGVGTEYTGEAEASYSGTWTFTWQPNDDTDWPAAYTITDMSLRSFTAMIWDATGSAQVSVTGGGTLASALSPTTADPVDDTPFPTVDVDTTDPNLTITTTTTQYHRATSTPGGWTDTMTVNTTVANAYTADWFTENFDDPYDIQLSFSVTSCDYTAQVDSTSTAADGFASALASASDSYHGNS